jgi:uncharacterized membrane protein YdjX (TVP38/TMEM64 family)
MSLKIASVCTLIISSICIGLSYQKPIFDYLLESMDWIRGLGLSGMILFMLSMGIASLFMIPTTLFSIVAGSIFQPLPVAVLIVLLASQTGIVLAFLLGRSVLRPFIAEWASKDPRIASVDQVVTEEGLKLTILLRLTPVFPFGICNYMLSSTSIELSTVMAGSLIGNLPNAVMHCLIGNLAGPTGSVPSKIRYTFLLLAVSFGLASSVYVALIAKRALRNVVTLDQAEPITLSQDPDEESGHSSSSTAPLVGNNPIPESNFTAQESLLLRRTAISTISFLFLGSILIISL